jgi:hypothetical protein
MKAGEKQGRKNQQGKRADSRGFFGGNRAEGLWKKF